MARAPPVLAASHTHNALLSPCSMSCSCGLQCRCRGPAPHRPKKYLYIAKAYMRANPPTQVTRIPSDKLVDTNGAGDAFVGGFLSQLVRRGLRGGLPGWSAASRRCAMLAPKGLSYCGSDP